MGPGGASHLNTGVLRIHLRWGACLPPVVFITAKVPITCETTTDVCDNTWLAGLAPLSGTRLCSEGHVYLL